MVGLSTGMFALLALGSWFGDKALVFAAKKRSRSCQGLGDAKAHLLLLKHLCWWFSQKNVDWLWSRPCPSTGC